MIGIKEGETTDGNETMKGGDHGVRKGEEKCRIAVLEGGMEKQSNIGGGRRR